MLVRSISASLDGYVAGPDQSLEDPLELEGTTFSFVTGGCESALEQASPTGVAHLRYARA